MMPRRAPDGLAPGALAAGVLLTIHRLSQGGADRVTILLANGFVARGIPTAILVLRTGGEGEQALHALLDPRVTVAVAGPPIGSRHLELIRGIGAIRRLIAIARPAIVIASSSNMGLVTGLCARGRGTGESRFVMKLTNPVLRPRDRSWLATLYRRRLYRFIFARYQRILILTEQERSSLAALFPALAARFVTVANPYVTPAMFEPFARPPASSGPHLLAAARFMPQKRLDRLLAAFARAKSATARLTLLGDGPLRAALEAQARALNIVDRVAMPGFVEDVLPWLRQADRFLLSSDYEGLPAAVLEALACNVPVITTDCFEAAHALLAGAARCAVVARDDPGALAAAIDASLASAAPPADLRARAGPYAIDRAIDAHVAAIALYLPVAQPRP